MVQEYLTIQEASDLVNKSFQTLRRAIKSNKLKYRRQRTPQGFNYLIIKDSLYEFYNVSTNQTVESTVEQIAPEKSESSNALKEIPVEKGEIEGSKGEIQGSKVEEIKEKNEEKVEVFESTVQETNEDLVTKEDLKAITQTLEKMINQHSEERQNFIRLINTLNEKIFTLESQIKLLSAPKKSWYSFWKK